MAAKEKGAVPFETTPSGTTAQADSTTPVREVEAPRGAYHPLSWRTPEVQDGDQAPQIPDTKTPDPLLGWHQLGDQAREAQKPFRGKHKRNSRREAIASKRHQGGISAIDVLAHLALGAWLATVLLWAWEALQ